MTYCKVGACRTMGGSLKQLHSFAGIAIVLMAVPLVITGFIAYFRRW